MWHLIAQQATEPDPWAEWVQFGVLGALVVAISRGWFWPKPAVDRVLRENDALRHRLNTFEHEILGVLRDILGMLRELREEIKELRRDRPQ